jgi:hypothetical protein
MNIGGTVFMHEIIKLKRATCVTTDASLVLLCVLKSHEAQIRIIVTLRLTVYCQSIRLRYKPLETHDQHLFFQLNTCLHGLHSHSLWREGGSVVYNCCWPAPAQSFSSPNPAGLATTFYCLRFETPPTWRAKSPYLYSPGTGWPSYTPRHWIPFLSPPTTRRGTVEVFHPAYTRELKPEIHLNNIWKFCSCLTENTLYLY